MHLDVRFANDDRLAGHHVEPGRPAAGRITGQVFGDLRVVVAERFERLADLLFGFAVRRAQFGGRDVALLVVVELERCAHGVALFLGQAVDLDFDASRVRAGRTASRTIVSDMRDVSTPEDGIEQQG